ncbi:VF530 family protein [Patescibacteria group bacterium]|jgi:uncharacterized protein (DUF2132 family)|nr:VF530 family protein [Patescibacteria group bacterium]
MPNTSSDPLHGKTLKAILESLVERHGWEELGKRIKIKSFTSSPSVASSLKFLRKTPWAREKVEELYLKSINRSTASKNDKKFADLQL